MNTAPNSVQQNLTLLQKHHPSIAAGLLNDLREQRETGRKSPFQMLPSADGSPILIHQTGGPPHFLHDRAHPALKGQQEAQIIRNQSPGLVVIYSCGLGYLPCALSPIPENRRVLILEPEYEIFFLALQASDWRALLSNNHVMLFVGGTAREDAKTLLNQYRSLQKTGYGLTTGRTLLDHEQPLFQEMECFLQENQCRFHSSMKIPVDQETDTACLVLTEVHRDLEKTLSTEAKLAGIKMRIVLRSPAQNQFLGDGIRLQEIFGNPLPGKILAFSPNAFSSSQWRQFGDQGIQRNIWFYDDPFRFGSEPEAFSIYDQIFCFDPILSKKLSIFTHKSIHEVPAATTFSRGLTGDPPTTLPEHPPVTFVGSTGLQRFDESLIRWLLQNPPTLQSLREQVQACVHRGVPISYEELLEWRPFFAIQPAHAALRTLEDTVTFLTRVEYLTGLQDIPFGIFGDEGWKVEKLTGPLPRFYAGRSLDFIRETPWIYQKSQININLFNVQCVNSPTVRLFDVLACGGFLLTEYRPFLEEMFQIGKELDCFRTPAELRTKVDYYLSHPDVCQAMAREGQQKILRDHLYRDRLARLIF